MVENVLVDLDPALLNAGERLVECLETAGVVVHAAFWMLGSSYSDWRLAIATATYETQGHRAAVEEVQRILLETGLKEDLDLLQVLLIAPQDAKVTALGYVLSPDSRATRPRRVDGVSAGPAYIDRAYVYRLAA